MAVFMPPECSKFSVFKLLLDFEGKVKWAI